VSAGTQLPLAAQGQCEFVGFCADHCFTGSAGKPIDEVVKRHPLRGDERLVAGAEPQADWLAVDVFAQALAEGGELERSAPIRAAKGNQRARR